MQTVNFPCVHCNHLMAVGVNLLGRSVRCPHCKQVVQAPQAGPPPAPELRPLAVPSPPEPPLPDFTLPPKNEQPDSIFAEEAGDDLFPKRPTVLEVPPPPAPPPGNLPPLPARFGAPPPSPSNPFLAPAPSFSHPAAGSPFAPNPFASPPAPNYPPPSPFAPAPGWPAGAGTELMPDAQAVGSSPFQPSPTASAPSPSPTREDNAPTIRRVPEVRRGGGLSWLLVALLAPYAVLMTVVAVTLFLRERRTPSQLEVLPDLMREFDRSQKGAPKGRVAMRMPAGPDEPLPAHLKTRLGQPLVVGDLQVTPERVEQCGEVSYFSVQKGNAEPKMETLHRACLLLRLKLKNVSSDVYFHPTDPALEREYDKKRMPTPPYTLIETGGRKFYGGLIRWPPEPPIVREYLVGQERDAEPLKPGEERETVVASAADDPRNSLVVAVTKANAPVVWRVHVRRGLVEIHEAFWSATAVIGVEFQASDIMKVKSN